MERQGIPAVLITTLLPVAQSMHVNRTVLGVSTEHPLGWPDLPPEQERQKRRELVQRALATLVAS